jgi:iron(II)-dependent oxidoreductase
VATAAVNLTADNVAAELDAGRRRTLDLLAPLDDAALVRQVSPLMSPLVWDLAHVGNYEDLWLVRALGGDGVGAHLDDLYDAFRHPRRDRPSLPLLDPDGARRYIGDVRTRALDVLDGADLAPDHPEPLLASGFVYGMVVQHEHQHDETMLATLQLLDGDGYRRVSAPAPRAKAGSGALPAEVLIGAGPFVLGTDTEPWAYDNERPAVEVDLAEYYLDTTPVTNGAYAEFVAAGGYDDARWWTGAGWAWRTEAGLSHPQFWERNGAAWGRNRFGWREPLPLDEPVQHVCWYEADAYARFRGRRLPTEVEWEKAASWDPSGQRKRRYPWGDEPPTPERANLGQRHLGPAAAGAYPDGASAYGVHQLLGDVWEWTASDFLPHDGFRSFPYREYSEVFFGSEYKVLRGGSWATHPAAIRGTFRNWDYPTRRQIFAGFRTARDA